MRPIVPALAAVALFLATTAPADAQDFTRRSYAFFDRQLAIEVDAHAPGTLHVVRGGAGRLEVAGRSIGGYAGYGLSGHSRDRLHLTPVGARRAEYMVVVPENVRVRVHLPDRLVDVPARDNATSWEWRAPATAGRPESGGLAGGGAGLPVAYHATAASAPRALALLDAGALRRLEVRVGGDDFILATSRVLPIRAPDAARLELRLGGEPADVIVRVPAGAEFRITADGTEVLAVRAGRGATACQPVTVQRLPGEERYTFTTLNGRLQCRAADAGNLRGRPPR